MILIIYGRYEPPEIYGRHESVYSNMVVSVINLFKFHKLHAESMHDLVIRLGDGMQSPAKVVTVSGLTLEVIRAKIMMSEIPRENEVNECDKSYTFTMPAMWTDNIESLIRRINDYEDDHPPVGMVHG